MYCILDQDDDTIWARVQRCYLPESSIDIPAQISDSINFPEGYIKVDVLVQKGNTVRDTMHFTYTKRTIDTGIFANTDQPLYYYVPTSKLDSTCTYRLLVTKTSTDSIIAEATTQLISMVEPELIYSYGRPMFSFYGAGSTYNLVWYNLKNARRYEPIIRFYYSENDGNDTLYQDISCGSMVERRSVNQTQSISYSQYHFLTDLKQALEDDPQPKKYLETVDIYIAACTEDLNAYINSSSSSVIEQSHNVYTNITGGLGIFAARRAHLFQNIPADDGNTPGSLYAALRDLNVGF